LTSAAAVAPPWECGVARFGGGGVEGRRWCIRAAKPLPSPAAVDEARRPHERLRSGDDVAMAEECCGREVIAALGGGATRSEEAKTRSEASGVRPSIPPSLRDIYSELTT